MSGILKSATAPGWFARGAADVGALLSDHLHCERKAAENALSLVRRYARLGEGIETLARLAHEETSHVIQVAALLAERGLALRADTPNRYARALLDEMRGTEPARLLDALLVSAFIEARSHERLGLLAAGFEEAGDAALASFYRALAGAEERHAETFLDLARPLVPEAEYERRLAELGAREAEIIAALPAGSRVH